MTPKPRDIPLAQPYLVKTTGLLRRNGLNAAARIRRARRPDLPDVLRAKWVLPDSEIETILRTKAQRVQCSYRVCGHPDHPPL